MAPIEYVSAAEAGRRIGVTEKTVRTWIEQGKLSAHHPGGVKNRLAIPINEVERIARERGLYQGGEILSIADLARQVEELRAHLAQQQAEIEQLKERQVSAPPLPAADLWASADYTPSPETTSERPARPARRQSATIGEPLPPGAILASEFARRHGVNHSTFRDHFTKGKQGELAIVSSRPKPGREERETEYFVMPEQQAGIFDFWRRHSVHFTLPSEQTEKTG